MRKNKDDAPADLVAITVYLRRYSGEWLSTATIAHATGISRHCANYWLSTLNAEQLIWRSYRRGALIASAEHRRLCTRWRDRGEGLNEGSCAILG